MSVPPAAKKNAPVELLREGAKDSAAKDGGATSRLAACRDPKEALELAAAMLRGAGEGGLSPEQRAAFEDRLSFVMKSSVADRRLGNRAKFQAILLALQSGAKTLPVAFGGGAAARNLLLDEFAFADGDCQSVDLVATASRPDLLLDAAKTLPATQMEPLLDALPLATDAEVASRHHDPATRLAYVVNVVNARLVLDLCNDTDMPAAVLVNEPAHIVDVRAC